MSRWSYMVTDTTTQTLVARHVPMTGVSFSDSLMGGGGTFQGSFEINRPEFSEWVSGDQMRRVIWPCRDGVPQGAYLMTACPTADAATTSQPVRGERLDWLFTRRAITKTLTFSAVDQNDILRDLLRFGMGRLTEKASPNQSCEADVLARAQIPWVALDATLSGVPRTRQETTGNTDDGYPGTARKIVSQMVENITKLEQGPEYRWLYRIRDGWPEMVLDTAGPSLRVGRPEAEAAVAFEYPAGRRGSVDSATYGSDGTAMTTRGHVIGQKQDTDLPVGMSTYDELLAQGYPLLDRVVSESSVQSPDVLSAKAAGLLWAADDAWSVSLDGGGNPSWGTYQLGDWVVLRVRQGRTPRRRSMRITGWSVEVDDSGRSEKVKPTLQVGKWF
jgi:hypothetical protein